MSNLISLNEDFNEEELLEYGYRASMIEGGFISPDHSTIVSIDRRPYIRKVMQYTDDTEGYAENLKLLRSIGAIK